MPLRNSKNKYASKLVSFWKHYPIADQNAETLAKKTLEFQQKFNCDFIKLSPSGSWQAVCYGVTDTWNGDALGRRAILKTIINTPDDWLSIPDFSQNQPAMLQEVSKACSIINKQIPDNIPILATVFCPISQAIQIAGLATFCQHAEEYPEKVLAGLEQITQNTLFIIDKLVKSGSKGLYFVSQHMSHKHMKPKTYKVFGEFFDSICLKASANSIFNIFHIHGENIFCSISNIPSNCFIHFENSPDISILNSLSKNYPDRVLIGISIKEMLKYQTEEQMEALLKNTPSGNVITASCVLPLDFPDERILNWVQFSKKHFTNAIRFSRAGRYSVQEI